MGPPRVSVDPNSHILQLSCSGKSFPTSPYSHTSPLMPLSLAVKPIVQAYSARPQLTFTRPPKSRTLLLDNADQLDDASAQYKSLDKVKTMRYLIKREEIDPYGQECWYSGSCVKVVDDLILFTGNDGSLKVAKLVEDVNRDRVFKKVPGDVASLTDKKLEFSRILSLHVQKDGEGGMIVGARHRWGVGVFQIGETEEEKQEMKRVRRIPCSEGLVSTAFLPSHIIGCLARDGDLGLWDIPTGQRFFNNKLENLLSNNYMKWDWGVLGTGFHPRSVLIGDRESIFGIDLRSGKQQKVGLGLEDIEHIRAMDSEGLVPYVYTVTDKNIILSDLRQTRMPVLKQCHGLGSSNRVWGMGRERSEGHDWVVVYDRWGDMALTVLDWGHSQCDNWTSQSDMIRLKCDNSGPSILGGSRGVSGWGKTVERGREAGEEWLDSCVEERCSIGFTGVDLARLDDDPVMIYAVNAAGDLFGMTVVPKDDSMDDPTLDQELVEEREDLWLAKWAESVVSCSLLPELTTICSQRPSKENLNRDGAMCSRVTLKTKEWRRRFRGKKKKSVGKVNNSNHGNKVNTENYVKFDVPIYNQAGLPDLAPNDNLPDDLYEIVTDDNGKKKKRFKVEKLRDLLNKGRRRKSSLQLTSSNIYPSSNRYRALAIKRFAPLLEKKKKTDNIDLDKLNEHFVPHFDKLDLNNYEYPTSYKYSNRHSESILKIMMGEGDGGGKESRPDSDSSYGRSSPAPPSVEDTTFTMDAFWADLGVDVPPTPSKRRSQARSFTSTECDAEDEN